MISINSQLFHIYETVTKLSDWIVIMQLDFLDAIFKTCFRFAMLTEIFYACSIVLIWFSSHLICTFVMMRSRPLTILVIFAFNMSAVRGNIQDVCHEREYIPWVLGSRILLVLNVRKLLDLVAAALKFHSCLINLFAFFIHCELLYYHSYFSGRPVDFFVIWLVKIKYQHFMSFVFKCFHLVMPHTCVF